jgi:hypothetical protein
LDYVYRQTFRYIRGQRKTASGKGTEDKGKAVLEILSNNGSMTGENIANQCSFESRMEGAGTIAKLVRAKAIEAIPASYRITETGRATLSTNGEEEQPKKSRRKSKKEPQEPSSQGDQPSP